MTAQLLQHPLEFAIFPGFQQVGYQPGDGEESYPPALSAGYKAQGRGQVGLTGTTIPPPPPSALLFRPL